MGSEWREKKLSDLTSKITKGSTPTKSDGGFIRKGVIFIKAEAITRDGRIDSSKFSYVTNEIYSKYKRSQLAKDDILFSMAGAILGKTALVKDEFLPANTNQALALIRPINYKIYPQFLLYFLQQKSIFYFVNNSTSQSAQPNINLKQIGDIKIQFPLLGEQKTIAHVLGSLDDKIELNRKMNSTLESMAQALFKSWFVDFDPVIDKALAAGNPIPEPLQKRAEIRNLLGDDRKSLPAEIGKHFPSSFVFSEESGWIPEGWEVSSLGEISKVIDCSHSKKPDQIEDSINMLLQVFNVGNRGKMDFSKSYLVSDADYRAWTKRIEIQGGDLVVTKTGRVGAVGQMPKGKKAAMGRNMVGIRARHKSTTPEFLKDCLLSECMKREMTKNTNAGTILKSLHVKAIQALRVVLPPFELVNIYSKDIEHVHDSIQSNIAESTTLSSLRDTLLPKLISGELRVCDAEKLVEKVL